MFLISGPSPGRQAVQQRGWQTREHRASCEPGLSLSPASTLALPEAETIAVAHRLLQLPVDVSGHWSVQGRKRLNAAPASLWSE